MGKTNNKNLKIDTLCLGFGSDDIQRTEVVYIEWGGKPFATAEECLQAFFTACDAADQHCKITAKMLREVQESRFVSEVL